MARKPDIPDRLLSAALDLAVTRGWRSLSLAEIAAEAGVSLAECYAAFPTKASILAGLPARADRQVLAGGGAEDGESIRDRLFDVIMRRLDALGPRRAAIAAILEDLPRDPLACLATLPHFANSMAWMLEAAGLSSAGVRGMVRVKGLALIYLSTLRVWLHDESDDLAQTMAALDRNLRKAETWIRGCRTMCRCCSGRRRRGRSEDSVTSGDEAVAEG